MKWLLVLSLIFVVSCKRSNDDNIPTEAIQDSEANAPESAVSAIGSAAGGFEGSVGLMETFDQDFQMMEYLDPQGAEIYPMGTCNLATARSSCNGAKRRTIEWNNCSVAAGTMTGGWTELYSDNNCLTTSGNQVIRSSVTGSVLTFTTSGAILTTTTESGLTWDGTSADNIGITVQFGASDRTIYINSLHQVLKGPRGRTWFDYHIMSTSGVTVSGTRDAGNRVATGIIKVFHNRAKYTATHTLNNVTWGSSSCCYPTSGTVTSTLQGSVSGNTTMQFSSTCGTATFTNSDGDASVVSLRQCQ